MVKVTARIGPVALAYQWLGMAGDSTGFKFLLWPSDESDNIWMAAKVPSFQ
jgi:hypothetical protein